jgi:hypothetical protein
MAKTHSHRRRHHSKSRSARRTRYQRGGNLAGNPASSWGWVNGTVGNGWTQFMNSLTLQPGQSISTAQSNNIVPVGNINAQNAQGNINTNLKGDISNSQMGGKKHRKRGKRGGSWTAVLNQAAAPVILLGAQQSFGKSQRHSNKFRDSRKQKR